MMTYRHKILSSYSYLPIVYGPRFFPLDAADSVDNPRAPPARYIPLDWPTRVHVKTRDHLGQKDHLLEIFKQRYRGLI